ncbi:glutamyl-tRNA(Gln) amidotransferase subunit A [Ferrovum sp. JA12]|uniref:amidase n=1 Tax=Ferrovum sp. JA12 TaxID=1356299 RepID=UPI000702F8DE|nr:amidase [Ferrovum sp. JA12]KRH78239.1 glutamyl-tRNA(Gln) amidotransferase subunit A [Ferrovum sp. JA12]
MKTLQDIVPLSVRQLVSQVQSGDITPHEIIQAYYTGIEHIEPKIHAWKTLNPEDIKRQLERFEVALDLQSYPLAGIPIGVKDLINTKHLPTSYGSSLYEGYQPQENAAIVERYLDLGGIILGKTVTTEFAFLNPGPTINPVSLNIDVTVTPGGSSSGSAAAVACAMTPLAFATQTAASITRPAAFCGVVGYKPSYGLLTMQGVKPLSPSLDTLGMMGLRVDDVAYAVGCLIGHELMDFTINPPVIGFLEEPLWAEITYDAKRVLDLAKQILIKQGFTLKPIHLKELGEQLTQAQETIMYHEMASSLAPEWQQASASLSPKLGEYIKKGMAIGDDEVQAAFEQQRLGQEKMAQLFNEVDILIAPSTLGEAPDGLDNTGNPIMSRLWTLLGNPTCHLPIGYSLRKLPLGLTVIGALHEDKRLLSYAHLLENAFTHSS